VVNLGLSLKPKLATAAVDYVRVRPPVGGSNLTNNNGVSDARREEEKRLRPFLYLVRHPSADGVRGNGREGGHRVAERVDAVQESTGGVLGA